MPQKDFPNIPSLHAKHITNLELPAANGLSLTHEALTDPRGAAEGAQRGQAWDPN